MSLIFLLLLRLVVGNKLNVSDSDIELCNLFSSNQSHEFYSPLYPKNYPHDVQCFKVIEAPVGHVIRLNFLEVFSIEEEETCKYDYLEIRDGQFGYSSLIQKICGNIPPSYIESSGRFLWLRFASDNDIHYVGFKVGIEFVLAGHLMGDDELCGEIYTGINADEISSDSISKDLIDRLIENQGSVDCTWIIQAEEDNRIYLQFPAYELEKPNDCTFNFVEVYGSRTELEGEEGRLKQFCGSEADTVTSKGNKLHVRFVSGFHTDKKMDVSLKSKFKAYFTLLRDIKEGQNCIKLKEFDCTDGTCIASNLRCNGKPNCKFRNDEDESCDSAKGKFKLTTDILIIAFLGILLMAGMCSGLMLNIYRKLKQDKIDLMEMKETLRKSRESVRVVQQVQQTIEESPTSSTSKETVVLNLTPRYIPPLPYNSKKITQVRDSSCQTRNELRKEEKLSPDFVFIQ